MKPVSNFIKIFFLLFSVIIVFGCNNENDSGENATTQAYKEMTVKDLEELTDTEKTVLLDFYAEWCGPCKMMKPHLEELGEELKDQIDIVRIDVDKNKALSAELKINSLPTLMIIKNKEQKWFHIGYADKATLKQALLQ